MITNIEIFLNRKGIRITPMRQLLLEYLLKTNKALGLGALEKAFPKADRITIYRTLKTFEEKCILHKIENGVAEIKYALCEEYCTGDSHKHPHFHCLKCGAVNCLEMLFIPEMKLPQGYISKEISMTIKGTCNDCSA